MTGWVLERLAGAARPVVVELCAGSGAITKALATELPAAPASTAVELSADAVAYLRRNLAGTDVDVRLGDMADAFGELDGTVDLVIANPPYVPLEHWADVPPRCATTTRRWPCSPAPTGWTPCAWSPTWPHACCAPAAGPAPNTPRCRRSRRPAVFVAHGIASTDVADHRDLTGRPRFVTARRAGRMGSVTVPSSSTSTRRRGGHGTRRRPTAVAAGEVIVLPTDTVYGVGADAFSGAAVQRLLDAKQRGRDMPPPVLVAEVAMVRALATGVDDRVTGWPRPSGPAR